MALTQEDLQAIAALMDGKLAPIKADMAEMMDDKLAPIKADIAKLNQDIAPKINAVYDCLSGVQEKFERLELVEQKLEGHESRIWALEQMEQVN